MSAGRSVTRRRLRHVLPAGLGGLACVACCTVPLLIAGGLTISSAALALEACLDSRLPAILIAGTIIITTTVLLTPGPGAASDAQGSGKPRPARVSPHQRLKIYPDPHSHTEPHSTGAARPSANIRFSHGAESEMTPAALPDWDLVALRADGVSRVEGWAGHWVRQPRSRCASQWVWWLG